MKGQTKINTCRVSELNKQNIKLNKIVSKFVEKQLKYMTLFEDMLILLDLIIEMLRL